MSLDNFTNCWRSFHGPLACHIPGILRYEQNHARPSAYQSGGEQTYDGLAVTWFASTEDMKKTVFTPEYQATRNDDVNFLHNRPLPIIITRETIFDIQR